MKEALPRTQHHGRRRSKPVTRGSHRPNDAIAWIDEVDVRESNAYLCARGEIIQLTRFFGQRTRFLSSMSTSTKQNSVSSPRNCEASAVQLATRRLGHFPPDLTCPPKSGNDPTLASCGRRGWRCTRIRAWTPAASSVLKRRTEPSPSHSPVVSVVRRRSEEVAHLFSASGS
jgi:hypothetical protein